jgi:formylmethanofuran dehydrogenase subunit C
MSEVRLTFRGAGGSRIPIDADSLTTDQFRDRGEAEIAKLPLHHGNQAAVVGDFFTVKGGCSDQAVLEGDLARVKGIGAAMSGGLLRIEGNVGMHVGARMTGGRIEVRGDADDWAGAEMTGGLIWIRGRAGNRAGGAYRGSKHGMKGGVLLVEGNAGHEIGGYMRRGLVVVGGDVEDFAGARLSSGTVLVLGGAGLRTGGGMKRGTIVVHRPPVILPTFRETAVFTPLFLAVQWRALRRLGFPLPDGVDRPRPYLRYHGDLAELGRGEILVPATAASSPPAP